MKNLMPILFLISATYLPASALAEGKPALKVDSEIKCRVTLGDSVAVELKMIPPDDFNNNNLSVVESEFERNGYRVELALKRRGRHDFLFEMLLKKVLSDGSTFVVGFNQEVVENLYRHFRNDSHANIYMIASFPNLEIFNESEKTSIDFMNKSIPYRVVNAYCDLGFGHNK